MIRRRDRQGCRKGGREGGRERERLFLLVCSDIVLWDDTQR